MKKVDEIYNETMKDLENYDVDAAFNKIVELANKETARNIEEFYIAFDNISKNSVGKEKQIKKTGLLKKLLAIVLLVSLSTSLVGCSKEIVNEDNVVAVNTYEEMLNKLEIDFHAEAHDKGRKIGTKLAQEMQDSYNEGNFKGVSTEDIVISINDVIDGDNWYEFFSTNLSMLTLDEINSQKYEIALTIYEGILETLGYFGYFPEDLDVFIESIIGKGIVLEYCEHSDELIYNNVDRELTEEEKVNNIILLARYYKIKVNKEKETSLTLK